MLRLKLDDWQKEVLACEGNVCLRSGRQVGKSTVISIKAAEFAVKNPNKTVVIIASVERQAIHLFLKIQNYLHDHYKSKIAKRMTLSYAKLKNGSQIHCLPAGDTGEGIRGFTVDLLIADEAAFIKQTVWQAVTPMLAITRGKKILLSTPHGKAGYFYDCFNDDTYTNFHISAEDCPRKDENFLANERKRMTKAQYAQEYLGEFIDDLRRMFSDELIKKTCILKRREDIRKARDYFIGVDIARMGEDESTFEIIDRTNREALEQVENIMTKKTLTTETTKEIINLNKQYDFKKIYVDDGGLGVGVFDQLLEEDETKRKVIPINNASRSQDRDKWKTKLLKEDLYNNLLRLMERGEVQMLDDDEIKMSLQSIQFEYTDDGKMQIFGRYSHIAEGLIRAAWCVKDKSLNITNFYKRIY